MKISKSLINIKTRILTLSTITAAACTFGSAHAQIIDPSTIPGMELRLDASAITGLTSGSAVTTWNDISGNGNNATNGTSAKAPTYQTGVMNGEPVVQFNGSTQYLNEAAVPSGAMTWFVVYQSNAIPSANQALIGLSGNVIQLIPSMGGYQKVSVLMGGAAGANNSSGFSPTLNTSTDILAVTFNNGNPATPGNYQIDYNQTSQTVSASGVMGASGTGNIGAIDSASFNFFNGDIAEIIAYNSVLSSANVNGVDAYLSNKWVATVPEPSTLALLFAAFGFVLLAYQRRSREITH